MPDRILKIYLSAGHSVYFNATEIAKKYFPGGIINLSGCY